MFSYLSVFTPQRLKVATTSKKVKMMKLVHSLYTIYNTRDLIFVLV